MNLLSVDLFDYIINFIGENKLSVNDKSVFLERSKDCLYLNGNIITSIDFATDQRFLTLYLKNYPYKKLGFKLSERKINESQENVKKLLEEIKLSKNQEKKLKKMIFNLKNKKNFEKLNSLLRYLSQRIGIRIYLSNGQGFNIDRYLITNIGPSFKDKQVIENNKAIKEEEEKVKNLKKKIDSLNKELEKSITKLSILETRKFFKNYDYNGS
tara:strand:- start:10314 stop:10949 length:636 start_codon:yes stop_codon:yes gene_type:complete